jgi:uncharacterized protein YjbJ (UPF0337 family)
MSNHAKEIFHTILDNTKEIIGQISSNDLKKYQGKQEKLAGYLEQKYNLSFNGAKIEAARLIAEERENLKDIT